MEIKPASLLLVPLGKALSRIPPSWSVSVNLFSEKQYTSNSKKDTQVNNMQKETKNFFFFFFFFF